jgi:hypothetical protein
VADANLTAAQSSDKLAKTLFFLLVAGAVGFIGAVFLFALS